MARAIGGGSGGTSCSIFVGNVPYDAQEEELRELFGKVGNVTSVRVVCDKDTKQQKGYAFCDFSDSNSVQAAIAELNNVEYKGRKLRIDWAERELHAPLGSRSTSGPGEESGGPGPPARRGAPPSTANDPNILPVPVPTVADRLARLRDQEGAEQARVAAAEQAERAEIGRLMETLTPQQVIHILGEMQRLALSTPEVARALLVENMQLALALQHAEFLAGMIDEAPLPTEPEVRERARDVREKIWGTTSAPAPAAGAPLRSAAGMLQQGILALASPRAAVAPTAVMPFNAGTAGTMTTSHPQTLGFMQTATPAPEAPPATTGTAPGGVAAAVPALPPTVLSQVLGTATDEASRAGLMELLVQLSPQEIDRLPHDTKIQLLEFLQKLPPRS